MSDFQYILPALAQVFTVTNLALIFGGLILGMIVGCIPGLSVTLGIILLLPLTYTFSSPDSAIIALLCVYVALTIYIGFIPAVIIIFPIMLWYCGERKPFIYIFTLAMGIGIFYLFKFVFHISLPGIPGLGG